MNRRNWQLLQLYTLRATVVLVFLGAVFGVISGIYGMSRYFTPTNQQTTK
jgi:hypothetical protein